MTAWFVDTNVLLYAVGGEHEYKDEARRFLAEAAARRVQLHASVELVQEFLFHRLRRDDRAVAIQQAQTVARLCTLHALDEAVVARMLSLVSDHAIGGRDAVHVATALEQGFTQIVTYDRDLAGVPQIATLTPGEALT